MDTETTDATQPMAHEPSVVGERPVARRTVLAAGLAVVGTAGVAAIAGCSKSSSSESQTSGPSAAAAGTVLAKLPDIPVGDAVTASLDGKTVLISQPTAGEVVAFDATCTHAGCTVGPAGKEFHCPCHGSVYDSATGKVIKGPAPRALRAVAVKVDGQNVVTA